MRKSIKISFVILAVLGLFFGLGNSFALAESVVVFGGAGDLPVAGDWNGDGKTEVGNYKGNGVWAVDYNGNGAWDGTPTDKIFNFGSTTDQPVTGDWNGDGKTEIGNYKGNGVWAVDYNGNGQWDGDVVDKVFNFGSATDIPVIGDWNGDGTTEIGNYKGNGVWALDYNGNGVWDGASVDKLFNFGSATDQPVTGDWSGDGKTEIGNYKGNGVWALDYNGNGQWDNEPTDKIVNLGIVGDLPVTGDWNGDGKDDPGVYRASNFSFHLYGPAVAVCGAGVVIGCKVCDASGMAWMDDDSKCASGQKCKNGTCVANYAPVVGAVRWDYWFSGSQALKLLAGDSEWHYRVPLTTKIEKSGSSYVPVGGVDDVADIDYEIQAAKRGGIDYWAFLYNHEQDVIYPDFAKGDLALKLYLSSTRKEDVKFSLILSPGGIFKNFYGTDPYNWNNWETAAGDIVQHFAMSNYQKTADGRPVIYFLSTTGDKGWLDIWYKYFQNKEKPWQSLAAKAENAGLKKPYFVVMEFDPASAVYIAKTYNFDAISSYQAALGVGVSNPIKEYPYQACVNGNINWRNQVRIMLASNNYIAGIVPSINSGWDNRPRMEYPDLTYGPHCYKANSVCCGVQATLPECCFRSDYCVTATPGEIASNVGSAVDWLENISNDKYTSDFKGILIYAWNEHDEGGWLAPTYDDRAAGNDYARLDALKAVINGKKIQYKYISALVCTPNAISGCKVCKADSSAWQDDNSKCGAGKYCINGVCNSSCIAKTCATLGNYQCGSWSDSCGGTINCGSCASSKKCNTNGQCIGSDGGGGGGNVSEKLAIPMTRVEILAKVAEIKKLLIQLIAQLIVELQKQLAVMPKTN